MSPIVRAHTLSSCCCKALIALHEKEVDFEFRLLERLEARPSAAQVPVAAEPRFKYFPAG